MKPSVSCTPMLFVGLKELEQLRLILDVRAGRVAEADAHAAVMGLELLPNGHLGGIADAPHTA